MCGIAGYIVTNDDPIRKRSLKRLAVSLLLNSAERGREAAGYAYVHPKTGFVRIAKWGTSATEFVDTPGHLMSDGNYRDMPPAMILHARYPTQGSVENNVNNHPLYAKGSGLCMVHNGWFTNDEMVAKETGLGLDGEVDSEVYLKLIDQGVRVDKLSIPLAIEKATTMLIGPLACAMIRAREPNKLWLWRDGSSPLVIARVSFGYVFASTANILLQSIFESLSVLDTIEIELTSVGMGELLEISRCGIDSKNKLNLKKADGYWVSQYREGKRVREWIPYGDSRTLFPYD